MQVRQAVRNNAVWCDSVCRAHGRPGTFLEELWINRHEMPRFYPNAVTLSDSASAAQLAGIGDLVAAGLSGEWGVKDSFAVLDLAPLGFRVLFDAQWICRSAAVPPPDMSIADVRWVRVEGAAALAAWEMVWGGAPHAEQARIFVPALLADENVAVIAAYRDHQIVAGTIANCAADVMGLSNLFVPERDSERFWAGCVAAAIDAFPDLPIVGYVAGTELASARALNFETLGPLRIWVRDQP